MNTNKYLLAGSAVAIALMTATPALADSQKSDISIKGHGFGLNLGSIVKFLNHDSKDNDKDNDGKDKNTNATVSGTVTAISGSTITLGGGNGAVYTINAANAVVNDGNGTTLSLASIHLGDVLKVSGTVSGSVITATKISDKTVNAQANVSGTVAALSGSTITLTGTNGTSYTVNAANATFNGSTDISALAKIQVGDRLEVKGTVNGTAVTATKITDNTQKQRNVLIQLNGIRAGVVSAVSGNSITLDKFGTGTSAITTNASTTYRLLGQATTSAALTTGELVIVRGVATAGAGDPITASVIYIIDKSADFIHGLFR